MLLRVALLSCVLFTGCASDDIDIYIDMTADFPSIQDELFLQSCTGSRCHSSSNTDTDQSLYLDEGNAYDALINISSGGNPSKLLVDPGNPENSFLIDVLEGDPEGDVNQMPNGRAAVPQAAIDKVRQWISDGASETI